MTPNTDRTGTSLALSLLILGLAAMLGVAAAPYLGLAALTDETAESRQLLAALEAQLARQSGRGGRGDPAALLLRGETPGIAGAALQRQINEHVNAAGGQASSFQLLPARQSGSTTQLALGFAMRIDIGGLRDVLHAIEAGEPLLFVDDIAIRTPENAEANGPLDVSMQVSGLLLADGGDSRGQ